MIEQTIRQTLPEGFQTAGFLLALPVVIWQAWAFFLPAFVPGTHLTIVGPSGSAKSLQAAFADQMDPAYFPVRLDHMPAEMEFIERNPGETFEVGGLRITPHLLMHPIPTFGYRIDEGDTRFAFATDNEIALFANNENGT